jgi:asparagine synthase (glutamine-hydrolysing)
MCGITGFWDTSRQLSVDSLKAIVSKMSNTLIHRGPDDGGSWADADMGIVLGHRRLSILDLSPEGHQPMVSADGRYIIVFNGEIYNFLELKHQLESLGYKFRGHSDTEVMLASFSQWGLHGAIERFNGMFAFALWDCQERVLHLGRDRLGEKPIYYGLLGKTFLFASELKALKVHPNFQTTINRDALTLYLRHNYIPAPHSIYQGIYKLPPGCVLTWNGIDTDLVPESYWFVQKVAELGVANPFTGSEVEAIEQLETLLKDAVGLRMIADVSLGAFLSGGIDSSLVVALMQAQSTQAVKTFTIAFDETAYNEAPYAKEVARYLGCDHTEFSVTPQETLAVIPKLPALYDEPFSDSSQVPTFLVSQLARKQVTVALSGDAGDELFAGYYRYFLCRSIWQKIGWMTPRLRQTAASTLRAIAPNNWNRIIAQKSPKFALGDKLHKLAEIIAVPDPEAMYAKLMSQWGQTEGIVKDASPPATAFDKSQSWQHLPDFVQRMMYLDTITYLPDEILVKVDRASMGVSLESRIPLLDPRVVEFAWRIPTSMKMRRGQGKWLLRQLAYRYVPQQLLDRPKMGFSVPINSWLRGSLRDWAEALLDETRLYKEGFFNPQPIRQKWTEHLEGTRNWQDFLWEVLMFQAWLEENF